MTQQAIGGGLMTVAPALTFSLKVRLPCMPLVSWVGRHVEWSELLPITAAAFHVVQARPAQ